MKMKWSFKKFITNMLCIVSALLFAGCVLSYFEVLLKHNGPNPIYSAYNFFVLVFKGGVM